MSRRNVTVMGGFCWQPSCTMHSFVQNGRGEVFITTVCGEVYAHWPEDQAIVTDDTQKWPECEKCRDHLGLVSPTDRAFRRGVADRLAGKKRNPYPDHRTHENKVTFSRALRNAWHRGYNADV